MTYRLVLLVTLVAGSGCAGFAGTHRPPGGNITLPLTAQQQLESFVANAVACAVKRAADDTPRDPRTALAGQECVAQVDSARVIKPTPPRKVP